MRIAIDIRPLLDSTPGGVKTYTTEIIRAMIRVAPQHEYRLFYNSARDITLPALPAEAAITHLRYPNRLFNASQWAWQRPRWDSLVPADCYFAPGLRLVPLGLTSPLVATVHDLSFAYFPEFYSRRRRFWHAMMRPESLYQNADQVIAVSENTARDVQEVYGVPVGRIHVVPSGVQPVPSIPDQAEQRKVRARYHLPDRFVLFLGTLEPRKNVPSVIKAFAAIAETTSHHLVIAGARGWLTKEIDRAVAAVSHQSRIHFPGVIRSADKSAVLASADLFVYPSFYEGFGFPPLEALLNGTPVITSANSALPEVVGRWATLVEPSDPTELAAVLRELLQRLPEVSQDTRREIAKAYSWDQAARKTLRVIERCL